MSLDYPQLPVVIFFVHFHCKELFINAHSTDIVMTACTVTKVSSQSYVTTKPQTRFCICIVIDTTSPNHGSNLFCFKTRENKDQCKDWLVTNGLLSSKFHFVHGYFQYLQILDHSTASTPSLYDLDNMKINKIKNPLGPLPSFAVPLPSLFSSCNAV